MNGIAGSITGAVRRIDLLGDQRVVSGIVYYALPPDGGASSGNNERTIRIPFSWGDATPRQIIQAAAGQTLFAAAIAIQVPFNGTGSALRLGDAAMPERFLSLTAASIGVAVSHQVTPVYRFASSTQIQLEIVAGAGTSQGNGFVILEVE